jgi:hypothetical protein
LPDEFPGRAKDKDKRLSLIPPFLSWFGARCFEFECFSEQFRKNRNEKCGGLAGTYVELYEGNEVGNLFEHMQAYLRRM